MTVWSYGITTVPGRYDRYLPETVESLAKGGFDDPILFIDGTHPQTTSTVILEQFPDLTKVYRERCLGPFSNFVLGVWELYLRAPTCDYIAMFQDDLVCYRNLKQYLEGCKYPARGYWNLYTWPCNIKPNMHGWSLSDQMGRGAVALVFSNEALRHILGQEYFVNHKRDSHRQYKCIDRAVVMSCRESGWQEYIHNPSLVQHTGTYSSCKNSLHPTSPTFLGEDFDAMDLCTEPVPT